MTDVGSDRRAVMPDAVTVIKRRARRDVIIALGVAGLALAIFAASTLWLADSYGPRNGIYLVPPSPERYASIALEVLDTGLYAQGPEWEAARTEVVTAAQGASAYADLYPSLATAVAVAGGKHSAFLPPDEVTAAANSAVATFQIPTVTTESGVTTVTLPALGAVSAADQTAYAEMTAEAIARAAPETCGWVVDLRDNTGGNMYPMLSAVSSLVPDGTAMSFVAPDGTATFVTVAENGGGINGDVPTPVTPSRKVGDRPIAVLQDRRTASSGEAILTIFRGLENERSFGRPSAGYTSANSVFPLYDGALLVLTGSVYVDRDGMSMNELPIAPDTETGSAVAPTAAHEWLAEQGCGS